MPAGDKLNFSELKRKKFDRDNAPYIHAKDRHGTTRTIRDELGNDLTHHWSNDERQDVTINAKTINVKPFKQE